MSYVRSHLAQLLDEVRSGAGPVLITREGAPAAVLVDAESYQRTREALAMLKLVALAEAEAARGQTRTHGQVFTAARKRLRDRLRGCSCSPART